MLSTLPEERNQRHRPAVFLHPNARDKTPIDVPKLQGLISRFMVQMRLFDGFAEADTGIIPCHAYIPRVRLAWESILRGFRMTALIVESLSDFDQLQTLADYLANGRSGVWPHPHLASIRCPSFIGGGMISREDFNSHMQVSLGKRKGCAEISWLAPRLLRHV